MHVKVYLGNPRHYNLTCRLFGNHTKPKRSFSRRYNLTCRRLYNLTCRRHVVGMLNCNAYRKMVGLFDMPLRFCVVTK